MMIEKVREQERLFRKELINSSKLVSGSKSFDTNHEVEMFVDLINKQETIINLLKEQYIKVSQDYREDWTKKFIQRKLPMGQSEWDKDFTFEEEYKDIMDLYNEIQEKITRARETLLRGLEEDKEFEEYKKNLQKNEKNTEE